MMDGMLQKSVYYVELRVDAFNLLEHQSVSFYLTQAGFCLRCDIMIIYLFLTHHLRRWRASVVRAHVKIR